MTTRLPQVDPASLNQRRSEVARHAAQIGIDYATVEPMGRPVGQFKLTVHFIPASARSAKLAVLKDIGRDRVQFRTAEGALTADVHAVSVQPDAQDRPQALIVQLSASQEAAARAAASPTYLLELVKVPDLDPFFAQVPFSLNVDGVTRFDCQPTAPSHQQIPAPEINYLARDYASFRQLMLDRLSVLMPGWTERNPADLGIALVEALAYAADQLSYYQDAVATEAYLGTARQRISVRRHARLLDYAMHEGCNARAWVQVQVKQRLALPENTQLLTRTEGQPTAMAAPAQVGSSQPLVFETLHPAQLDPAHNEIQFYTWGARAFGLPQGATGATLSDAAGTLKDSLRPGDVLILEEVKSPHSGDPAAADPSHRHAVRLTAVVPGRDALLDQAVVEVEWHAEDALPFPLTIASVVGNPQGQVVSVARGNVVLADHGRTVSGESLQLATVPGRTTYRSHLSRADITHAVPYQEGLARQQAAAVATQQDPRAALPSVTLDTGDGRAWQAQPDLLRSNRFQRHFVVETENDRRVQLRFGDGVHGRQPAPGLPFTARYRIGNGEAGNIGRETICHIITTTPQAIISVRNPLPAQGGRDPESIEEVRHHAPQAMQRQERAVTTEDYVRMAERHPQVRRAAAALRWTGSWHTIVVAVQRVGDAPLDPSFKADFLAYLKRFRLTGYGLEVCAPRDVPLDIALTIYLARDTMRSRVHGDLLATFSRRVLPDGRRGFFHPDHFGFGQSVYASRVVQAAMQVPGVAGAEITRFQRWGESRPEAEPAAEIPVDPLEIARLDNQPHLPHNGIMRFDLVGGR